MSFLRNELFKWHRAHKKRVKESSQEDLSPCHKKNPEQRDKLSVYWAAPKQKAHHRWQVKYKAKCTESPIRCTENDWRNRDVTTYSTSVRCLRSGARTVFAASLSIIVFVFLSAAPMLPIMFSSLFNFSRCQQVPVSLPSLMFPF